MSQIFIRHVTVLDCAVFYPHKGPKGHSWYVDVAWFGQNDSEGVLYDFSLAKRQAKKIIDEVFDHKLWIGHASAEKSKHFENRYLIRPQHAGGSFSLSTYAESLCFVEEEVIASLVKGETAKVEAMIADRLLCDAPQNINRVSVTLRSGEESLLPYYFSYTHSLRHHYGNCQRFHGHSNIIEVFSKGMLDPQLSLKAASFLKNAYLVAPEYITDSFEHEGRELYEGSAPDGFALVQYQGNQGRVFVMLPKTQIRILPSESTIENIAHFVKTELSFQDGVDVLAYEGLMKGARA